MDLLVVIKDSIHEITPGCTKRTAIESIGKGPRKAGFHPHLV